MIHILPPRETIRACCQECLGLRQWNAHAVKDCQGDNAHCGPCPLFSYRFGGKRVSVKVFRRFCLQCMGGDRRAVGECQTRTCPLHPYRFGTNPLRQGISRKRSQTPREKGFSTLESKNSFPGIGKVQVKKNERRENDFRMGRNR